MKKAFQYILIIVLFSTWGILLTNKESFRESFVGVKRKYIERPCSKPLEYSLGEVDSRFGITRDEFLNIARESEKVWEEGVGRNLLEYNPQAPFKLNLIFDERQFQTNESQNLEEKLENLGDQTKISSRQYESLKSDYEKRLAQYEKSVAEFSADFQDYQKEVKYWNSRGGAPEDEYEKLQKKQKELDGIQKQLEKERKNLKASIDKINTSVQKTNQAISTYNRDLETYQNKYGGEREFEKGLYDGTGISIYEFREKTDLKLTLIHEMGHSLEIGHLENPQSIMYYLLGEQDLENPKLTEEDLVALKKVCGLD